MKDIVKVCDYCGEVIEPDAPAMQTTSVYIACLTGYNGSRAVVPRVRSYHLQPNCYRWMCNESRAGQASLPAHSSKAAAAETLQWRAAFGLTADEALSGRRYKFGKEN